MALSTLGGLDQATALARQIVGEKLAACVNIIPNVRSVFRWKGEVQEEEEALMVIKTIPEREAELKKLIRTLHPYDVPELLFLPCGSGLESYLKWVNESCSKGKN